jgi:hypothetical protein
MSEFFFGLGRGRVSQHEAERCDRIARKHGAAFVAVRLPGDGPRYWFAGPNRGSGFDDRMAAAVMSEVGTVEVQS